VSGEIDICEFALSVGGPGNVFVLFPVKIVKMNFTIFVREAGNVDNSSLFASLDLIEEKICEQKVTNVINSKLLFKALGGRLSLRKGHDTCII